MKFVVLVSVLVSLVCLFAAGCANEDGSSKKTKLIVDNVFVPTEHAKDCKDGLQLDVQINNGRVHSTPKIQNGDSWDYNLFQRDNAIHYELKVNCFSSDGTVSQSEVRGKIPGKGEDVLLANIVITPPMLAKSASCKNANAEGPCVQN